MDIRIGNGLGPLRFGMSIDQVTSILGKADKEFRDEAGDTNLHYNEQQLVLRFERENQRRLGWIEVHPGSARAFGVDPWVLAPREVTRIFSSKLGEPAQEEDHGAFDSAFFEDSWLELQFELGRLRCINFGVLYGDDDQPVWPHS